MSYRTELFVEKQKEFLTFLKTRYSLFHQSNLFFRDLHYGVMAFLEMNGQPNAYTPSEELTHRIVTAYEQAGIFLRIDDRSWMLNYLPFKKAPSKLPAPAKAIVPGPKPVIPKTALAAASATTTATPESVPR